MEEIWKDIEGYEGIYQVSNLGRVRSLDREVPNCNAAGYVGTKILRGKILKPLKMANSGYMEVHLKSNGQVKHGRIHRLVAEAFIPNPDNLPEINHKDEDKTNNRADNLEWCDRQYNSNYGTRLIRISDTKKGNYYNMRSVQQLSEDGKVIRTYPSVKEAAAQTGASESVIIRICKGQKGQTAKGYRWRYAED